MPSIPFANNFLAGSLISLLLPIGLLIALMVWYVLAVRRIPEDSDSPTPSLDPTDKPPGAAPAAETPTGNPGGTNP